MAPVTIDPDELRPFETAAAFERWLSRHHDRETVVWIRFYKKASGVRTIVYEEALDVALCWGWIDGQVKSLDQKSYAQRFTPRRPKSLWSQINREHVARLEAEGRMTEHGRRHVEAAKRDGRWDAAYASPSKMELPEDLAAAIAANRSASATLARLDKQSRYALAFRVRNLKTAAGRARKIRDFVSMLASGKGPLDEVKWRTMQKPARTPTAERSPKKKAAAARSERAGKQRR
jgi:uncharacterized protein YdeI (YjbR/CyaY-like superfamily)